VGLGLEFVSQNPSEYAPEIEVIWAKGKPKLKLDGISEGSDVPDKSRHKFLGSIHWGSFLPNTSLEKQRSIEMSFLEKQEMDMLSLLLAKNI